MGVSILSMYHHSLGGFNSFTCLGWLIKFMELVGMTHKLTDQEETAGNNKGPRSRGPPISWTPTSSLLAYGNQWRIFILWTKKILTGTPWRFLLLPTGLPCGPGEVSSLPARVWSGEWHYGHIRFKAKGQSWNDSPRRWTVKLDLGSNHGWSTKDQTS